MRRMKKLAMMALAASATGCVEMDGYPTTSYGYPGYGYNSGYYAQPVYYPQPTTYYQPAPVVPQTRYVPVPVPTSSPPPRRHMRDRDHDGIPDRYDSDKNGDGIPDHLQRRG